MNPEKRIAQLSKLLSYILRIAKMQRHHVHLSKDKETATQVGSRRGKPVILTINAQAMHEKGLVFYVSDNGVWLTEHVPPEFISA